jgi:hypothetical protein
MVRQFRADMRHSGPLGYRLIRNSDKMPALAEFLAWSRPQEEKPVMSRLAIALVVALAATGAKAQDTKSGQSDTPPVASANGTRPFLFDGRMPGDGVRRGAITDDHHSNAGTIVMPPKASQPARER